MRRRLLVEGWMTRSRRSGIRLPLFRSQWIRRYFVLALSSSGPVLEEYHCDKKETLRKTYDLSKCEQVDSYLQLADTACGYPRFSIVSQWIFSLHLNCDSRMREVFFVAQSEREMILWVEEICRASGLSRAIADPGETPTIRFPSRGEEIVSSFGLSSSDRSSESITDNNISDVTSDGMHREKNHRSRYQSGRNSKQNGNGHSRMTPAEKKISLRNRNASGELQRASSSASACSSMASSHHTAEEDNSSLHSTHSAGTGPPLPPKPVRARLTHQSSGGSSILQYGSRSKGMDLSQGIPAPSCTLVEVENESSGETIKIHSFSTRGTPPPVYTVPNGYLVIPSVSGSKTSSVCSSMAIGPTQGPPVDRSKKPAKLRLEQGDEDLKKNNTLTRTPRTPRTPQSANFRTNSRNRFDPPRSAGPIGRTAHLDYFEPTFEKMERAVSVRSATPQDFDYIKIDAVKTQHFRLLSSLMAYGWKRFTGQSQYPELTSNRDGSSFTYGTKQNRNYRMGWLQGKRNVELEQDMLSWVSRTTATRLPLDSEELLETLHDGKILCRFLEKLNPRALNRPVVDKQPLFCATDNVMNFLESLKNFGLQDEDLFAPNELLEKRNITGLISTLKKLHDVSY